MKVRNPCRGSIKNCNDCSPGQEWLQTACDHGLGAAGIALVSFCLDVERNGKIAHYFFQEIHGHDKENRLIKKRDITIIKTVATII